MPNAAPRHTVFYWALCAGGEPCLRTSDTVKTWRFFAEEFEAQMWARAHDAIYGGLTLLGNPRAHLPPVERLDVLDTSAETEARYKFMRHAGASLKHPRT